ncbi:MAG: PAS domain-containing sensor histidine kinase [Prolixibacteraceae bacterium]|jgi:PAS domain S-box-containing protein|nr:PAS domain-containing sensor histidine kinase [Prolixibacteraceae bacterium]
MRKLLHKIRLILAHPREEEIFETRIFSVINLLSAFSCVIAFVVFNYINTGGQFATNLILVFFGLLFAFFFYLSFFKGIAGPLVLPFQLIVAFGLVSNWFFFEGIEGSMSLFFFPAMLLLIYSDPRKRYWRILGGFVFLSTALTVIYYFHPEWTIPFPDKESRIIDLSVSLVLSLSLMGYISIVLKKNFDRERLLTQQQNMELKTSEARFRDIAMSSGDWIWEVDKNGIYTYCSEKVEEILGYTPSKMIGKTPFDFMPENEAEKVRNTFEQIVSEKKAFRNLENWNLTQSGQLICVLTSGVPVFDDQGELSGYRGADTDITRRKQAEEAIKESEARLRELNATKDKFFSIISHDLRSPFASIIGLAGLMTEKENNFSPDDYSKFARSIEKTAGATYRLLENLLEWSQLQRGGISFKPENIDIKGFFASYDESTLEMARKKSIELNFDYPPNMQITADRNMLHSILRNLVINAIKFTKRGGAVSVKVWEKDDGKILFSVQDTGIGMDKEQIDKLFCIDTNVNRPGTDGEPSAGLGLILCKEFIEKHNGRIWVESEEGKGSTFYFTLPGNTTSH